jgi:hypothetical protein
VKQLDDGLALPQLRGKFYLKKHFQDAGFDQTGNMALSEQKDER